MLNLVETFVRKTRRRISRSQWLVRLLGLKRSHDTAAEPGLVLIQIDGLGRHQLEVAIAQGHLPFLSRLLEQHKYRLHSLYSGMPSSTPAMTAELLYGVKCAVPAFSFYDRQTHQVFRMFDPPAAKEIESRLRETETPLLAEGSAYAAIYTGSGQESHFCAAGMGLSDLFAKGRPFRMLLLAVLHLYGLLRIAVLFVVEFVLAWIDFVRGLIAGEDLWRELKFIPSRVGVCILLRELSTIGAKVDTARGLPIIYLDLIGYDEQSHRRGPTSRFAHWSLKGIDDAIKRIWKAAHTSPYRDYDVWIFSDHGNEDTLSYTREHGCTVHEAVARVLDQAGPSAGEIAFGTRGIQSKRMKSYVAGKTDPPTGKPDTDGGAGLVVAAMGPIGHVYLNRPIDADERQRIAKALVEQADIPTVLVPEEAGIATVWTRQGRFTLPQQAHEVLAPNHPFLPEVTADLIELCHHPNAGDFIISGWNRMGRNYTFPIEGGSHGGPALEETHAFALLPQDAPLADSEATYIRPTTLRQAALRHLGRDANKPTIAPPVTRETTIRVLTYNVHSCVGIDGKLSPRRIARVIARYRPDVVALQEVDVGRARTNHDDQARIIADHLEMQYHFHPTIQIAEEAYGDCVLSRLPMRLIKTGVLPTVPGQSRLEPRGAIWVAIDVADTTIGLVNTHLGLRGHEKLLQIDALLGSDWLGAGGHPEALVLCGDFNASPKSRVWERCARRLRDVQIEATLHKPRGTWFGHYPLARIDHIFISPQIEVSRVEVGGDHLARVASDHRPLFAELKIRL